MPRAPHPPIVNAGYRSTNFWVVSGRRSRLLVDLGWPGQVGALLAGLRRLDVPIAEVRHGIATHYHIDHAGAAEDLKAHGLTLVLTPEQVEAVPSMARWTKPDDHYLPITMRQTRVVPLADSRAFLAELGLDASSCTRRGTPTTRSRSCSTRARPSPAISRCPD